MFKEISPGVFETASGEKFTNHQNLPQEVVAAVMQDHYTDESEAPYDYSASNLTAPAQQQILKKRHKDSLRIFDVTDKFASFFGSVAHQVLENAWHESMGSIPEERIYMNVNGKRISGKLDLYHEPEIRDYKTAKVYKVAKGLFDDWTKAQNIYAALCRANERPVEKITIVALLKDWDAGETYKENYPSAPIKMIDLDVWSQEKAVGYIQERVLNLIIADGIENEVREIVDIKDEEISRLADIELMERFPCSPEDMWQNFKDFAVMKPDAGRATKSFDDELEAHKYIVEKGWEETHVVEARWSKRTRCIDWCECSPICRQNAILNGEDPDAPPPLF